ncbi:hypothetical protein BpHYR1_034786 [Brachionus plicatilis]|uniref:Uncharacterized protein n=1 Tax=Brachionus plicatilis TaxID=10195 RepID=A0A3M7Q8R2_BRAPC|nr:hypothetical protein BpHYR1_034786 [Brachionus plicatilis]
MKIVKFGVF